MITMAILTVKHLPLLNYTMYVRKYKIIKLKNNLHYIESKKKKKKPLCIIYTKMTSLHFRCYTNVNHNKAIITQWVFV